MYRTHRPGIIVPAYADTLSDNPHVLGRGIRDRIASSLGSKRPILSQLDVVLHHPGSNLYLGYLSHAVGLRR